ncbi:META domain-containing protein [Leucobacter weissii]|uniref:META domain-containing protein n=1 Tax=Leucobacter weissii TaxID=1983706 RepID=A0A939MJM3_9MICO|nr:META domain-containing protein [Leucobacter weissii]MBO1902174.1 META domain-containing protein [Leucobacter weissii]
MSVRGPGRARLLLAALALGLTPLCLAGCSSAPSTGPVGTWGDPGAQGEPHLVFDEDGRFSGSDGCNRVMGSWRVDGDRIDLGEMASTMMYCEGVDTWLNAASTAVIRDDALVLNDADGAELGVLPRGS